MTFGPSEYFLTFTTAGASRPWSSFTLRRVCVLDLIRLTRIRDELEAVPEPNRRAALMALFLQITLCPAGVLYLSRCDILPRKPLFGFHRPFRRFITHAELEIMFQKAYRLNIPQPDPDELTSIKKRIEKGETGRPVEEIVMELVANSAAYWKTDITIQLTGKNIFQLLGEEKLIRKLQAADSLRDLEVAAGASSGSSEVWDTLKARAKGEERITLAEAIKRMG